MCKKSKKKKNKKKINPAIKPYNANKISKESIYSICTANSSSTEISIDKIINGSKY